MEKIEINKKQLINAYKEATKEQKRLLIHLYGEELFKPQDITDRIKTFDNAYFALGVEHPFIQEFINKSCYSSPDLKAYMKLRIICAALNEGWKADFSNFTQEKWFPWFCINDGELMFANAYNAGSSSVSFNDVRLAYKTKELAEYAGKQFREEYQNFLL